MNHQTGLSEEEDLQIRVKRISYRPSNDKSGFVLESDILDFDTILKLINKIRTDSLIADHVLNCVICGGQGLVNCKELQTLKDVWS